jgi:transposase
VFWGLVHRDETERVESIGVDEIAAHKGHRFLTLIYQIDGRIRRLLWVGVGRSEASLAEGLDRLSWVLPGLRYICSDLAPGYLKAIREKAGKAVHVLDRFHVALNMNKAVDAVRAEEVRRLKSEGKAAVLTHSRWCLLKQPRNLNAGQASKLRDLMKLNLRTIRGYLLKQSFETFWQYRQGAAARRFLKSWTSQAMRSRLKPFQKLAKTIRRHEELLINWVRARGEISNGITEGLNNKAKVALRKSYGFRTDEVYQVVLYHQLGALPEPDIAHKFC